MKYKIMEYDDVLKLYEADLDLRVNDYHKKREELIGANGSIVDFANGHEYFGIHRTSEGWVYREWAPGASKMYLAGEFNGWNHRKHPMERLENGVFEIKLSKDTLWNGCKVLAIVEHDGQELERIPLYARRVVQDPTTYLWSAEVYDPETPFAWTDQDFHSELPPYIYECHVGMAQEERKVGSYLEFADKILPRIQNLGYNTIQIMAIMEHPYYGSFGYQIGSFFAPASRSGMPEDLKYLVNKAHSMGIRVLLDVVHSHAAKNTREGINEFDGTDYQFFHSGARGYHQAWDTRLFNYGKNEVIHFLLSNLKYWMKEFHFDGFRFDGVTSMLYLDHGLGTSFDNYDKYFSNSPPQISQTIHNPNSHSTTILPTSIPFFYPPLLYLIFPYTTPSSFLLLKSTLNIPFTTLSIFTLTTLPPTHPQISHIHPPKFPSQTLLPLPQSPYQSTSSHIPPFPIMITLPPKITLNI